MEKKYKAAGIGFFLALLLSVAFTGGSGEIWYSYECINGLDDDGDLNAIDGGIDVEDAACFSYPFNDGNGESVTPANERYTSSNEYASLFAYHRDYGSFNTVCSAYGQGYYDLFPEQKAEADIWLNEQGLPRFNCPP
jgi:hypothetical protein